MPDCRVYHLPIPEPITEATGQDLSLRGRGTTFLPKFSDLVIHTSFSSFIFRSSPPWEPVVGRDLPPNMDRVTRYPIFGIPHSSRMAGAAFDGDTSYTFELVGVGAHGQCLEPGRDTSMAH